MGKVINYLELGSKLHNQKTQLSKKKYKQWEKLSEWAENEGLIFLTLS